MNTTCMHTWDRNRLLDCLHVFLKPSLRMFLMLGLFALMALSATLVYIEIAHQGTEIILACLFAAVVWTGCIWTLNRKVCVGIGIGLGVLVAMCGVFNLLSTVYGVLLAILIVLFYIAGKD